MQWFSETSQWDPGLQSSRLKERIHFIILFPFPFKCIFSSLFQIVVIEEAYCHLVMTSTVSMSCHWDWQGSLTSSVSSMGFSLFDIYRVHGFFLFFVVHGQWGFPDAHCLAGSDPSAHLDTKYNIEARTILFIRKLYKRNGNTSSTWACKCQSCLRDTLGRRKTTNFV